MQKKQTYLIFLLAVLLYPAVYQFVHIFPHQHHITHAECEACSGQSENLDQNLKEKHDDLICHVYDFQYSINEVLKFTALLPYRGEVAAVYSIVLSSPYSKAAVRLSASRAPPVNII